MIRLRFFALLTLLASSLVAAERDRPNIILILADDMGYHDLHCVGFEPLKTPNIDRLAAEGTRATDFYVTWPACTPSRGSILTGRYPGRNGLYDMIRNDEINYGKKFTMKEYATTPEMTIGLDVREVVIAQPMHAGGYATGVVGKWDSGRARRFLPLQRGFDFFYGFANTGIDYWTHERYGVPSMFRGNDLVIEKGYATDLFRREALRFIQKNKDRPFFLYLPFNAPHGASNLQRDSYQAPDDVIARYPDLNPKANRTKYFAMISSLDSAVGEIMSTLKDLGLDDNTLVIFTSDNGGIATFGQKGHYLECNKPLRGKKGEVWEGGFREPFIARWPGKIPDGKVTNELLTSLEFFPTFLAVAGLPAPEGDHLDGYDMLPVLEGKEPSPRHEMFWEHRGDRAARIGQYKWVDSILGGGLFDLSADIGERHDLSKEKPDLLASIKARYADWQKEIDASEPRGPFRNY